MLVSNRMVYVALATSAFFAVSAWANSGEIPDPRGPMVARSDLPTPHLPYADDTASVPPEFAAVSSGYRSVHFNSYFTASFVFPFHVTADGDDLFVSDASGNFVKMFQIVSGSATYIRTFGAPGSGAGQFSGPEQVAVVGNDLFVADFSNNRVQRFNRTTGAYVSQFGSPGSGAGQFNAPSGVVYNPVNGLLYVSEVGNDRVQVFSTAGIYQGQFGALGSGDGQLNNPYALAVDGNGNIYAADTANNRVSKFDSTGLWIRNLAVGLSTPLGIAVDKANVVWVAGNTGEIYAYEANGSYLAYYYGSYTGTSFFEGYIRDIRGLAVTAPLTVPPYNGAPAIAVVDSASQAVELMSISAQPTAHAPITAIPAVGGYNAQIAFDSSDNVFFASYDSNTVYKFDKFGAPITQWGSTGTGNGQFDGAMGVAVDGSNNVYVADRNNNRIQKFDNSGNYITQWGSLGTGDGQFNHPSHIATDGSWLYVTEENNNRVQKFSFSGAWVRKWGTAGTGDGQFSTPTGIAVDSNRNQVYVGEYGGSRVQQFSVFGDFIKVFTGTTLNGVLGLATDQHGNLYVSDLNNNRVVQFNDGGTFLSSFPQTGANGLGVNPRNGQLYSGALSGGVVTRFAATMGKTDTVGIYRPATHTFLLRKSLTSGTPDISAVVALADIADIAMTGDWNGDGVDTPGLYRPSTSTFYLWDRWSGLSIANPDYSFVFGNVGDRPIVGDWNGDGKDGVGVFRTSTGTHYLKNDLVAGPPDYAVVFGSSTDAAVAGDWNGDGASSAGVYRRADGRFHVTDRNFSGTVAESGSYPLGSAGDVAITGDWTHSGYAGIGVFRPGSGTFILKYNLDNAPADTTFTFDSDALFHDGFEQTAADTPLAGNWGSVPE